MEGKREYDSWRRMLVDEWKSNYGLERYVIARMMGVDFAYAKDKFV